MPATNYSVQASSPTAITEFALPHDLFLYNTDANNTIYLDSTRGLTTTTGFPLPPNSSKRWIAGQPCFARCVAGQTAVLNVSDNAGEVVNPAAIAAAILQQGLAQQIATDIVASTLAADTATAIAGSALPGNTATSIAGSTLAGDTATAIAGSALPTNTATQISVTGAPPIDLPGIIHNATQNVVTNVAPVTTAALDVSIYNFLEIWVAESGVTTPNALSRSVTLNWYADAAATILIHRQVYWYGAYNGNIGIKVPTPGGAVVLKLSWTAVATVQTVSLHSWAYGSMRMGGAPSSYNGDQNCVSWADTPADSLGGSGMFIYGHVGALVPSVVNMYPQSYEGPARLYVQASVVAAGGSMEVLLMDNLHGNAFTATRFGVAATLQAATVDVLIPRRPIKVVVTVTGANVTNPGVILVMTPW